MTPWAHQLRTVDAVLDAIDRGVRRIAVTVPTGGGKGWIIEELARRHLEAVLPVALFTNRRMLTDQTSDRLVDARLSHGVRAAGWEADPDCLLQLCSIQTEHSRVMKRRAMALHAECEDGLVLVDEGHLFTGDSPKAVLDRYHQAGAVTVLMTATPIGLAEVADELIVGATNSELRECGALVRAVHYGPSEPDLRKAKAVQAKLDAGENPSEAELRKVMPPQAIWGNVWEWFEKINPERRTTLLFASGVEESIWFAEAFTRWGVPAAHIDGDDIWLEGKLYRSDRHAREDILARSRDGSLTCLCNRFVLREGIDCPWLQHGIFATVFGSLQSYLQSGGRLLRSHPSLTHVTVQDHGGNYWRHGSLNEDREWFLNCTGPMLASMRADRLRDRRIKEPFTCPQCRRVWVKGRVCSPALGGCGYVLEKVKRSRPVIRADGRLTELTGSVVRPRRPYGRADGPAKWERMYWRSRTAKGRRNFRQAFALFAQENNWGWPSLSWPFMPLEEQDQWRLVEDVPMDRLVPKGVVHAKHD